MSDLSHYPMVAHSYILELKYLKTDATKAEAAQQWTDAEEQIRQYAEESRVKQLVGQTQLHLLILQISTPPSMFSYPFGAGATKTKSCKTKNVSKTPSR